MVTQEQFVELLLQGAAQWNEWRNQHSEVEIFIDQANLSGVNLSGVNLSKAVLIGADLSDVDLSEAYINGATLLEANLSGADLRKSNLSDADLRGADFSRAQLQGAQINRADLSSSDLSAADLRGVYLCESNLSGVNLSRSDLSEADLRKVDLRQAICESANFSNVNLIEASLIGTNLDGATLTGAHLWETQRAGWSVKNVICEFIYWDEREITKLSPSDFERLYEEKVKVKITYPGGAHQLEITTLPALIQHLESTHIGCKLRLDSIQDAPGGAVVTVTVEGPDNASTEQLEQLRIELQAEAEQKAVYLRQVLDSKHEVQRLIGYIQASNDFVDKLLSTQKSTLYLKEGNIYMSEFKNTIGGNFQGAMGDNSSAQNLTYSEDNRQLDQSINLSQLAQELSQVREAMVKEAKESSHYDAIAKISEAEEAAKENNPSKVVESLKAAGNWSLDFATRIGASLAADAIGRSIGIK